jgi:TatA/E family protein of Tat protein translocase
MLSIPHLAIIFVVALVVFGPEKLPELARTIGKVMTEFRRHTTDLRSTFEAQLRELEREADQRRVAPPAPAPGVSATASSSLPVAAGQPAETSGSTGAPGTVPANPPYAASIENHSASAAESPAPTPADSPSNGSSFSAELPYGVPYGDPSEPPLDTSAPDASAPVPSESLPPAVSRQHSET